MKLPALQPVRTGKPDLDSFLEAVKERLEIREGSRGDTSEKTVLRGELESLGVLTRTRVALPDGKPGFVTQLADGRYQLISATELLSRLGLSTDTAKTVTGATDASIKQQLLAAIGEEATKRAGGDSRLEDLLNAVRDNLTRRLVDLAARLGTTIPAETTPPVFDTFTVSALADGTRELSWAYTTTKPPVGYEGAQVRWAYYGSGSYGTDTWDTMTGWYDGILTQSPFETRAGAAGKYRFAIKSRALGVLSTDTLYYNVDLPDLATTPDLSLSYSGVIFLVSGSSTSPSSITLTANLSGGLSGFVTWAHGSGTFTGTVPTGANTWTVGGGDFTGDSMTFTASLTVGASTYTDTVTLYRITQGTATIVPVLTNPYIGLAASASGVVSSFGSAKTGIMQVYYGGVLQSSGLTFSVHSDPDSLGVTISNTSGATYGQYSLSFPGSPSGWWTSSATTSNVTLRAALTADPGSYRDIALVVSKQLAGTDGTDFNAVFLTSSSLTMGLDSAGAAYPAAQAAALTLTRQPTSLSGTATFTATAYNSSSSSLGSVTLTGSGDSRSLTSTAFMQPGGSFSNSVQYVDVVATVGALSSTVRIVRLTDGAEPIISGLTKPSVALQSANDGTVSDYSGAQHSASAPQQFKITQGGTTLSSGVTYSQVSFTGVTAVSGPYAGSSCINPSTGEYGVSSITWSTGDTAQITFRATHSSGATRDAVFTITRVRAGATGADAQLITLTTNNANFAFTTTGAEYPSSGQSATFTVTRTPSSLAGTVTWSATAYSSTGSVLATLTSYLTGSGDSRTLTAANFILPGNPVQYVDVTATLGSLATKSVRILRITDGQEPYLSILTTGQSVSVPADSTGAVTSWSNAAGSLQLYQGGSLITSGLTYSIQANPSTLTATMNSSTGAFAVTGSGSWANSSNQTTITFRVALTAAPSVYRDVPLTITKQVAGVDGISYEFSNQNHTVPADSAGAVTSYTGSGTTIRMLEGSTYLTYHSTTLAAGRFTIGTPTVSPAGKITVGAISGSTTTTATVAVASAMDSATDVVTITFPVTVRRANGADVTLNLVQTIAKTKSGSTGTRGSRTVYDTNVAYTSTYNNGSGAGSASYKSQATTLIAAAVAGLTPTTPIKGDTVVFSNGTSYSTTYSNDGTYSTNGNSSWSVLTQVIDGSLLVTGTVSMAALKAGTYTGGQGVFGIDTSVGAYTPLAYFEKAGSTYRQNPLVLMEDDFTGTNSALGAQILEIYAERSAALKVETGALNVAGSPIWFSDGYAAAKSQSDPFFRCSGNASFDVGWITYAGTVIGKPDGVGRKILASDGAWRTLHVNAGGGATVSIPSSVSTKPGTYTGAPTWIEYDDNGTLYEILAWRAN